MTHEQKRDVEVIVTPQFWPQTRAERTLPAKPVAVRVSGAGVVRGGG